MKFTRDNVSPVSIRQIGTDSILIGDVRITQSVVLTHEQIIRDWSPPQIDSLSEDEIEKIMELQPEIVILGGGSVQRRPPNEFIYALARRGIGLEIMDTGAACRTFNILLAEGRRLVALLTLG